MWSSKLKFLVPTSATQAQLFLCRCPNVSTRAFVIARSYSDARTPQTETHKINSFQDLGKRIKKTLEGDPALPGNYGSQSAEQNLGSQTEKNDFFTKGFSGTARLMQGKILKVENETAYVDLGKKYPGVFQIKPTKTSGSQLQAGTKVSVRVSDESFTNDTQDKETPVEFDHVIDDDGKAASRNDTEYYSTKGGKRTDSDSKHNDRDDRDDHNDKKHKKLNSSQSQSQSQSTSDPSVTYDISQSNDGAHIGGTAQSAGGPTLSDGKPSSTSKPYGHGTNPSKTSTSPRLFSTKAHKSSSNNASGESGLNKNRGSDSSNETTSGSQQHGNSSASSSSNSNSTLADDIKRERPMSGKSNMPGGDNSIPAHSPDDPKRMHKHKSGDKKHLQDKSSSSSSDPVGKKGNEKEDPNAPASTRAINYDTV